MLEAAVKPTQRRVLDMTGTLLGQTAQLLAVEKKVGELSAEMSEALGTGNGTLKDQIMKKVEKHKLDMQREHQHTTTLLEKLTVKQDGRIHMLEGKIKAWHTIQTENAKKMDEFQDDYRKHELKTHEIVQKAKDYT